MARRHDDEKRERRPPADPISPVVGFEKGFLRISMSAWRPSPAVQHCIYQSLSLAASLRRVTRFASPTIHFWRLVRLRPGNE